MTRKLKVLTCIAMTIIYVILLSSCGRIKGSGVIVAGSTSVQPYAEILAEEFAHIRTNLIINIQGGGSSAGITAVENGTAEIGMSSRSLKEKEEHLWSVEIAKDGLAIIVHPDNPVSNLSFQELRDIYTNKTSNWSSLGGANMKIHIIAREEGSGTRSAFEELVMGEEYITSKAIVQNSNGAVRQIVCDDPYAIGFISLGLVESHEEDVKPVKALQLEGNAPTQENVKNGTYSLYRPFLFVMKSEPAGAAKDFIDYVLSDTGQQHLIDEGLISVTKGTAGQ